MTTDPKSGPNPYDVDIVHILETVKNGAISDPGVHLFGRRVFQK